MSSARKFANHLVCHTALLLCGLLPLSTRAETVDVAELPSSGWMTPQWLQRMVLWKPAHTENASLVALSDGSLFIPVNNQNYLETLRQLVKQQLSIQASDHVKIQYQLKRQRNLEQQSEIGIRLRVVVTFR